MATKPKLKIFVHLEYDEDAEDPIREDEEFNLISRFDHSPYSLDEQVNKLTREQQQSGKTCWLLSCYRHGGEHWFLLGDTPAGADQFDTTVKAGVLYLESGDPSRVGPTPREAAKRMLDEYNRWLAGGAWYVFYREEVSENLTGTCPCCETPDVNWYETRVTDDEDSFSCIGLESALDEIGQKFNAMVKDDPDIVNRYEIAIVCDSFGEPHRSDVAAKARKAGFKIAGDKADVEV